MKRLPRREALRNLACGTALPLAAGGWTVAAEPQPAGAKPPLASVDVLVCGGGPAGVAAAILASRLGAKTLLVERYGRLGGMAVQAMVGPLMGHVESRSVDWLLAQIGGRAVDYEFIDVKYAQAVQESGAEVLLHAWVVQPLLEQKKVVGARLMTKQGLLDVQARVTIDATGDGDVAFGAGAEFDQGRGAGPNWSADGLVQPMTIMFRVSGVKHEASMDAHGGRGKYRFPDGRSWDQLTRDANARGELPAMVGKVRTYMGRRKDERVINATQVNHVDGTRVRDLSQAELEGRRQVLAVMEFLRKNAPGYENAYVSGMPAVIGVRETRRIRGLAQLVVEDVLAGKQSPTAVVRRASFGIDIHNPDGIGQAQGVSADHPLGRDPAGKPYDIPYGCLVPRGVDGLLVAGRCLSATHEALASCRVQVIAMATGVAAGTAAALAAQGKIEPRAVDVAAVQKIVFGDLPSPKRA